MKTEPTNKNTKIIFLIIGIVIVIAFMSFFTTRNNEKPTTASSSTENEKVVQDDRNEVIIPLGEIGHLSTLDIQVHGFEYRETLSDVFGETKAKEDTTFILVDASFINTSGESFTMYSNGIQLINEAGISYDVYKSTSGGAIGVEKEGIDGRDLGHGIEERGYIVYEVPSSFTPYAIRVEKAGTKDNLVFEVNEKASLDTNTPEEEPKEIDYTIVEEKDISYANCKRIGVSILVPDDAKKKDVDHTMYLLGRDYFMNDWDDVTIWSWGYGEKSDVGKTPATKGIYEDTLPGFCN